MILSLQDDATAVYWASRNGHDEIVRVLLAAKATVNTLQAKVGFVVQTHFPQHAVYIVFVQSGETPLYAASFNGHQQCMELLIDAGAIVDIPKEVSVVHTSQRPLATEPSHVLLTCPLDTRASYRIASNVCWCKFSYELPILIFHSLNIRTAQHSDVEHIVQGNFRMMLYNTKYTNISTIRKLPAIRYVCVEHW